MKTTESPTWLVYVRTADEGQSRRKYQDALALIRADAEGKAWARLALDDVTTKAESMEPWFSFRKACNTLWPDCADFTGVCGNEMTTELKPTGTNLVPAVMQHGVSRGATGDTDRQDGDEAKLPDPIRNAKLAELAEITAKQCSRDIQTALAKSGKAMKKEDAGQPGRPRQWTHEQLLRARPKLPKGRLRFHAINGLCGVASGSAGVTVFASPLLTRGHRMISTTTLEELISAEEAAKLLGLHEQTLAKWRCTGQQSLPFIRVGRAVRYRRRDIEAWLNSRTVRRASNT